MPFSTSSVFSFGAITAKRVGLGPIELFVYGVGGALTDGEAVLLRDWLILETGETKNERIQGD